MIEGGVGEDGTDLIWPLVVFKSSTAGELSPESANVYFQSITMESGLPTSNVNGVRIHYEERGDGFPLTLLHPWPTDHAMWMMQVSVFSELYRVITPDSRGLGKSGKPEGGYDLRTLAKDVQELLGELGVSKTFVVGSSLGASVAQRFTLDYPEMVQGSVWVGAPTFPLGELIFEGEVGQGRPFVPVYIEALKRGGFDHFWQAIWKPTMPNQFHESFAGSTVGSYLISYLFESRYSKLNKDVSGAVKLLEALDREAPIIEELKAVSAQVPCALVTADGDDTKPAVDAQHRLLPKVDYLCINKGGHFCFMDEPGQFNGFLQAFLEKNKP